MGYVDWLMLWAFAPSSDNVEGGINEVFGGEPAAPGQTPSSGQMPTPGAPPMPSASTFSGGLGQQLGAQVGGGIASAITAVGYAVAAVVVFVAVAVAGVLGAGVLAQRIQGWL
jgi:hypothetical protein